MPFSSPFALFEKLFDASADTRLYSYADPWKLFVPPRVIRFTTPPSARPYSAVKLLVWTLYSCTASIGTCWPTPAVNSLLLATPSSSTFVLEERRPLIAYPTPRPLALSTATFGTVATKSYGLRLNEGNSVICCVLTVLLSVCDSVFT